MRLPENLREQLKKPLGLLIPNSQVTKENIQKHIPSGFSVITVGDATTENLINFGIIPDIQIVDRQEKRQMRKDISNDDVNTKLSSSNPAGEITKESIDVIKTALDSKPPVRITINGEEDLLVIPVCIYSKENTILMYGQPNEGLVVLKITTEIKDKAQKLLDLMYDGV